MNAPTPEDVFKGVRDRLKAEPGWDAAVPGETWYGKRPAGKVFPYAVGMVEAGEPSATLSDGTFLQPFAVEVTVWAESTDAAAADTNTAGALVEKALGFLPSAPANGVAVANAVAVVHVKPLGGSLELSDDLRKGQDVFSAGKRVEVLVHGKRV